MIVVERESVAKKRGAPVHAYITGIGASNNDRGMVESLAETQLIAIRVPSGMQATAPSRWTWWNACHKHGSGDAEESRRSSPFPVSKRTVLTSFKSQIGHTLGASGLNSSSEG